MRRFSLPLKAFCCCFSLQLCGVRGGGEAASQAMFWRPRNDLSLVLAFESTRERNTAIMLARRFAVDCNVCAFTKRYVRVSQTAAAFFCLTLMKCGCRSSLLGQATKLPGERRWHLCSADTRYHHPAPTTPDCPALPRVVGS